MKIILVLSPCLTFTKSSALFLQNKFLQIGWSMAPPQALNRNRVSFWKFWMKLPFAPTGIAVLVSKRHCTRCKSKTMITDSGCLAAEGSLGWLNLALATQCWSKKLIKQQQEAWPDPVVVSEVTFSRWARGPCWLRWGHAFTVLRSVSSKVKPKLTSHVLKSGNSLSIFDKMDFRLQREKSSNSKFMWVKNSKL